MDDPSVVTNAVYDSEVQSIEWESEFQPLNHPIKTGIKNEGREIYDIKTGKSLAFLNEDYKAYWFHSHLHIKPKNYKLGADEQEQLRLQGGQRKDLGSIPHIGKAIGHLAKAGFKPNDEIIKQLHDKMVELKGALIESPVNELP